MVWIASYEVLEKGLRSFGYGYWSAANREAVTVALCVHFLCQSQAAAISQPGEQTRWQMGPPQTLTLPTPHMPHLSTQAGSGLQFTPAPSCCMPIHHNNLWALGVCDCLLTIRGHMFASKLGSSISSPIFSLSSFYTSYIGMSSLNGVLCYVVVIREPSCLPVLYLSVKDKTPPFYTAKANK